MSLRSVCNNCGSVEHRSSECSKIIGEIHVVLSNNPHSDHISLTIVDQHAEATAILSPHRVAELTKTLQAAVIVKERQSG